MAFAAGFKLDQCGAVSGFFFGTVLCIELDFVCVGSYDECKHRFGAAFV